MLEGYHCFTIAEAQDWPWETSKGLWSVLYCQRLGPICKPLGPRKFPRMINWYAWTISLFCNSWSSKLTLGNFQGSPEVSILSKIIYNSWVRALEISKGDKLVCLKDIIFAIAEAQGWPWEIYKGLWSELYCQRLEPICKPWGPWKFPRVINWYAWRISLFCNSWSSRLTMGNFQGSLKHIILSKTWTYLQTLRTLEISKGDKNVFYICKKTVPVCVGEM